jgi:LSD1 subclass zinc finger protein
MNRFRLLAVRPRVDRATPFFCPTCGGDRVAEVSGGRRLLVIGLVPLLPWTRGEAHVRCATCRTVHATDRLEVLTTADLAARLVDLTRILTVTTVRAGDPGDRVLRRRAVQHVRTAIPGYHQNQLDIDMVALDPATVAEHVAPVADSLEVEGKERLVANMVHVALAAHTISSHQRWLLDRVGTSLGLTPMHVTGIISAVASAVEPAADDPADRP